MSQQPHPDRVRLLPWSLSPWLIDGILTLVFVGVAIARIVSDTYDDAGLEVGVALVAITLILLRRHYPIPALAAVVVAAVGVIIATEQPTILMLTALVILYTVATDHPWRVALVAGGVTMVAFTGSLLAILEPGRFEGGLLAAIAWPAFAVAAGMAIRTSRENLSSAQARAERAEATRELEARRRVVEERLRIARDVHDLVAHHLAVVNVQSGVASHLLRSDPDAADTALEVVRSSVSTAVTELGDLLGVLRDPGDPDQPAGSVEPTPDLGAVDDLVSSFSASGLTVEHRTTGAPRPLGPSAQVAVYRVIQEALTNAHKHGDGSAALAQTFDDEATVVEVSNRFRGPAREPDRSGYGLIGMRERVEAVGGQLSVERRGAHFIVTAVIPVRAKP